MSGFELTQAGAKAIAEAVAGLPGIAGMYGGSYGEISLLYPGERIKGLRKAHVQDDTHLEIFVIADLSAQGGLEKATPLHDLTPQIREAVQSACPEITTVDVIFADVSA